MPVDLGGRPLIADEPLRSTPIRLPQRMREYLLATGNASAAIRELVKCVDDPDSLPPDPGPSSPSLRSSYTLPDYTLEKLVNFSGEDGGYTAGLRRVVQAALDQRIELE